MSLARVQIDHPIEVQEVATTANSRLIKAAMLEVYIESKNPSLDAYTAKIDIVRYLRNQSPKPAGLSAATDTVLQNAQITPLDVDIALNELKQNDHFLFQVMGTLMTASADGTHPALDTYDAHEEVEELLKGKSPRFLAQDPAYVKTIQGFHTRNFTILETDYAFHPQRLGVVEVLTHDPRYNLDAQKAFDIVTITPGDKLAAFLIESGYKKDGEKNEVVEERHDHHNFTQVVNSSMETPATPVVATSSTSSHLSFLTAASSSAAAPAIAANDSYNSRETLHKTVGYVDNVPTYALILLIVASACVIRKPVTHLLQKMGFLRYNGYETAQKANQRLNAAEDYDSDDELDLEAKGRFHPG